MSNEIFLDGICEIDDNVIQSYFSQFGSPITTYESHRHRPTNSCCFAFLTFVSPDTVNAILRDRPHSINHHSLFVKRLLPPRVCSFIERLLPVSSLFVYIKASEEFDQGKLKTYFETYGHIIKFDRDHNRERLLIEYDDYDSVDRIFLNKDSLPYDIIIHKNILPRAQSTIKYHGTCRRKQTTDEKKKKRNQKEKGRVKYPDDQYQDLLQKTIENLTNCKAQLRNKENDFVILQIEFASIKDKNDKLNQLLDEQNQIKNACLLCKKHEVTIERLQQTLTKLNEQYDTIKSQYQRLLSTQYTPTVSRKPDEYNYISKHQHSLSSRLNNDHKAFEKDLSQFNLPTPGCCDIVTKQENSPSPIIRPHIRHYRTTYKYNTVKSDED